MESASRNFAYGLAIAFAFWGASVQAEIVGSDEITVSTYHAYGDHGNGDVIFRYVPAYVVAGCDGVWIAPSQAGAKNMIATVISAKLTSSVLSLHVENSQLWNGSAARYCKAYAIGLK